MPRGHRHATPIATNSSARSRPSSVTRATVRSYLRPTRTKVTRRRLSNARARAAAAFPSASSAAHQAWSGCVSGASIPAMRMRSPLSSRKVSPSVTWRIRPSLAGAAAIESSANGGTRARNKPRFGMSVRRSPLVPATVPDPRFPAYSLVRDLLWQGRRAGNQQRADECGDLRLAHLEAIVGGCLHACGVTSRCGARPVTGSSGA